MMDTDIFRKEIILILEKHHIPKVIISKLKKNIVNPFTIINTDFNKYRQQLIENGFKLNKIQNELKPLRKKFNKEIELENYIEIITTCLKENNISDFHLTKISSLSDKNSIIKYIENELVEIISNLSNKGVKPFFIKNKKPNNQETKIKTKKKHKNRNLKYRNKIIQCLNKVQIPHSYIKEIEKLNSEKLIVNYIKENLKKYIPILKDNKILPFYKEKTFYTQIIYTPQGNKR